MLAIKAQDTLPRFSAHPMGLHKVRISWVNPFGARCTQLNVQRSFDSLSRFKTIFSSPSPQLPQNGIIDDQAWGRPLYYRIFFVLDDKDYAYTFSQQPSPTGGTAKKRVQELRLETATVIDTPMVSLKTETVSIKVGDSVLLKLNYEDYLRFRDSIMRKTKDTLFTVSTTEVLLKPFKPKEIWKPSKFVYTARDGLVIISLPSASSRHYRIKIFDERGDEVADLKHLKDDYLTLDKGNFFAAGWYFFELYDNNVLKEKNKFYVWKDF